MWLDLLLKQEMDLKNISLSKIKKKNIVEKEISRY